MRKCFEISTDIWLCCRSGKHWSVMDYPAQLCSSLTHWQEAYYPYSVNNGYYAITVRVIILHSLEGSHRQSKTYENVHFLPTVPTVAVQRRWWTMDMWEDYRRRNSQQQTVEVTESGWPKRTYYHKNKEWHNICAEDCLQNEIWKANQIPATDKLNELVDHFTCIHKGNQYNRTEMEEENSASKENANNMPQLNMHAYAENTDIMRQSGNRTSDQCKCRNQTQIQETTVTTRFRSWIRKADRLCYN